MIRPCSSRKAVRASSKETPSFCRFARSLAGSHSNWSSFATTTLYIHRSSTAISFHRRAVRALRRSTEMPAAPSRLCDLHRPARAPAVNHQADRSQPDWGATLPVGRTHPKLKELGELQRAAQWRLDFIAAKNSMGFHASQEMARILGDSIDL